VNIFVKLPDKSEFLTIYKNALHGATNVSLCFEPNSFDFLINVVI